MDSSPTDGGNVSPRSFVFTPMTGAMYEAGISGLFSELLVFSIAVVVCWWLAKCVGKHQQQGFGHVSIKI